MIPILAAMLLIAFRATRCTNCSICWEISGSKCLANAGELTLAGD
jgi:hypothetical protein